MSIAAESRPRDRMEVEVETSLGNGRARGVADWRGGPTSDIAQPGMLPLTSADAVWIAVESRSRDRAEVETSLRNGRDVVGETDWRGGPTAGIEQYNILLLPIANSTVVSIAYESRPRYRMEVETSLENGLNEELTDWRRGPTSSIAQRGMLPSPRTDPVAVWIAAESRSRDRAVLELAGQTQSRLRSTVDGTVVLLAESRPRDRDEVETSLESGRIEEDSDWQGGLTIDAAQHSILPSPRGESAAAWKSWGPGPVIHRVWSEMMELLISTEGRMKAPYREVYRPCCAQSLQHS